MCLHCEFCFCIESRRCRFEKNGIKTKIQLQNFNEIKINLEISFREFPICTCKSILLHWVEVFNRKFMFILFSLFIGSKLTNVHAVIQFNGFMNLCKIRIFSNQIRCAHDSTMLCLRFKRKSSFYDGASGFVCWCVMQSKFVKLVKYFSENMCAILKYRPKKILCWIISNGKNRLASSVIHFENL